VACVWRDRRLNNAEFVRIVKNDNVTNVNACVLAH